MSRKIIISCGDPSGIGPEIAVRALKKLPSGDRKRILLTGNIDCLKRAGWGERLCPALNISAENFKLKPGRISVQSGLVSFKSFVLACRFAAGGFAAAVVTAPVSKEAWKMAGLPFMGHTDYLEKRFKTSCAMSFHKGAFNSFLITEHIPLKKAPSAIKADRILEKFRAFLKSGLLEKKDLIVFSGLNPHCGENGFLGLEEERAIKPAMRKIEKMGFKTAGPFNPDDVFLKYEKLGAKAAVFMYHDQLLAPLRLKFGSCVHATWQLPFIRTSPSHGCAFDIAWKNKADCSSMLEAVKFALERV